MMLLPSCIYQSQQENQPDNVTTSIIVGEPTVIPATPTKTPKPVPSVQTNTTKIKTPVMYYNNDYNILNAVTDTCQNYSY